MRALLAMIVGFVLLSAPLASAGKAPAGGEAESYRLEQELEKLVRRNTWKGVERTYEEMLALSVPLTPQAHIMGSQAAMARGDVKLAKMRLDQALPEGGEDAMQAAIAAATKLVPGVRTKALSEESARAMLADAQRTREEIDTLYGAVTLEVREPRLPALVKFDMPFSAQEREAVVFARETLQRDRLFNGLIPLGTYMIDGKRFTVEAGAELQAVVVGD